MVNDSMKSNKLIGMIQPKKSIDNLTSPILHNIGCLGKITSFEETEDGRYLIELKGLIRFRVVSEIKTSKKYREYMIDFNRFNHDLDEKKEQLKFSGFRINI
jgi:Lon protease-like protein